jgi:hypothetical protein
MDEKAELFLGGFFFSDNLKLSDRLVCEVHRSINGSHSFFLS